MTPPGTDETERPVFLLNRRYCPVEACLHPTLVFCINLTDLLLYFSVYYAIMNNGIIKTVRITMLNGTQAVIISL